MTIPDLNHKRQKDLKWKAKRQWPPYIKWGVRAVAILACIICLFLWMLSFAVKPSEDLRIGFENYFSEFFQYDITIGAVTGVGIFPQSQMGFEHVTISQQKNKIDDIAQIDNVEGATEKALENDTKLKSPPPIKIDAIDIRADFWGLIFGFDRLRDFTLRGASFPPHLTIDHAVLDPFVYINPENGDRLPGFSMRGTYKDTDFALQSHLKVALNRHANITHYYFPNQRDIDIRLGDIEINGKITFLDKDSASLNQAKLRFAGEDIMTIEVSNIGQITNQAQAILFYDQAKLFAAISLHKNPINQDSSPENNASADDHHWVWLQVDNGKNMQDLVKITSLLGVMFYLNDKELIDIDKIGVTRTNLIQKNIDKDALPSEITYFDLKKGKKIIDDADINHIFGK